MTLRSQAVGTVLGAIASPLTLGLTARAHAAWRWLRGRPPVIELYAQVDDPGTYLVAQLLASLRSQRGVEVEVTPVAGAALPTGAQPPAEARMRHAIRDASALARRHDVDFPDRAHVPEPALIRRAEAVMTGGDQRDIGAIVELCRAVWEGDELALARLEQALGAAPADDVAARLARGRDRLEQRGHYASGAVWFDGTWALGADRLHYIEEMLGPGDPVLRRRPEDGAGAAAAVAPAVDARAIELYYSFRSPFSYLALERTFALADACSVGVDIRPILPGAMRGIKVPLAKRIYLLRDARREADRLGIPFGKVRDPIGAGTERCQAVFAWARTSGRERELALSLGRGIWAEALDPANDRDLAAMVERAGLPWSEARDHLADTGWRDVATRNLADLHALGLWGVPTLRAGDVVAWGQDRIWVIEDALRGAGHWKKIGLDTANGMRSG